MRKLIILLAASLTLFGTTACGDDDKAPSASSGDDAPAAASEVAVTARDYAFDVPATFKGGLITLNYKNAGKEPHFAAFARAAQDKTFADVKAALTAPPSATPSGPPPFEEFAGAPTADPGATGNMTFNMPAGTYALFCSIPSPDGTSHAAKGMVTEVTVTEGRDGTLPDSVGTVTAQDFSLTGTPTLKAGKSVVKLQNEGKQLHEINLVELAAGKKVEDIGAWFAKPAGPPPHKSLSGVAIKPGQAGTTELDLKAGSTYAFICVIPDVLGDFKPHLAKGMATAPFTV